MCTYFGAVNLSYKFCLEFFFCEGTLFGPQPNWRLSDLDVKLAHLCLWDVTACSTVDTCTHVGNCHVHDIAFHKIAILVS
jgi:hypothetical protein